MLQKLFLTAFVLCCLVMISCSRNSGMDRLPNIILIYADDLGNGDVSSYGAQRVSTPNIDRLAEEGLRFTDAYAAAATCTPSRYALLTGEYAWRKAGTGIARGDAPLIIHPGQSTLPALLGRAGYTSGVVGKWHLGLGTDKPDWNRTITPGPLEIGFDYAFLMPATGDRVPTVYIENHHVVDLDPADPVEVSFDHEVGNDPTGITNPELLKVPADPQHSQTIVNGISRIGSMSGGNAARWVDEDIADVFTGKALSFIEKQQYNPFFLFFSLHDIHVPRVPHPRFVGTTDMGPRGDAIVQADWCVGEILETLDHLGLSEHTLVIFTSDNGPVLNDGYMDEAVERAGDHHMAGPLRGGKYSSFEGGTRVPFLVRWPARIQPGESQALFSQVDFFATFAALTGQELSAGDAPDSIELLQTLVSQSGAGRNHLVQQATGGYLSLRDGPWKYIVPSEGNRIVANKNIESGRDPEPQLYYVANDVGEVNNVADEQPDTVAEMQSLVDTIRRLGDRFVARE